MSQEYSENHEDEQPPKCVSAQPNVNGATGIDDSETLGEDDPHDDNELLLKVDDEESDENISKCSTGKDLEEEQKIFDPLADTDSEDENKQNAFDASGRKTYVNACEMLGVVPVSYFMRHIEDEVVNLRHHGLGPHGAKAMSLPLVGNTSVLVLNLDDNWLGADGVVYISEMLKENCYIADLSLADNRICSKGAQAIAEMLLINTTVKKLNLAGNMLQDKDAECLSQAILENRQLQHLDLSRNEFSEEGGVLLGAAIGENETLEYINLSWNHFRRKGALAICDGIKGNTLLKEANLSMNGFGAESSKAVAEIIRVNGTLRHLDVSNNRLPADGMGAIAKALDENEILKVLKIGHNPLSAQGALLLLKAVKDERSVLETLDLSDVRVDKEFKALQEEITEKRNLTIKHGGVLGDYVIKGPPKKDGIEVLTIWLDGLELNASDIIAHLAQQTTEPNDGGIEVTTAMTVIKGLVNSATEEQFNMLQEQFDSNAVTTVVLAQATC